MVENLRQTGNFVVHIKDMRLAHSAVLNNLQKKDLRDRRLQKMSIALIPFISSTLQNFNFLFIDTRR